MMKRKTYKILKRILWVFLALIIITTSAIGGLLYYIYRNQDVIADMVLKELNDMQRGHTTLKKVYVNPYANFPYISIDLHGLAFYAQKSDKKPIYAFQDVYLGFNIWNIIEGDYTIKRISVKKGELNLVKDENGNYNLLLAKSPRQKMQEKGGKMHLDLRKLTLENVRITKKDVVTKQFVSAKIEKLTTSFSYIQDVIKNKLDTKFTIEEVKADNITLAKNKHIHINSQLTYNLKKNFLQIAPSELELEGGEFKVEGSIDVAKNVFADITIQGRKPDFKLITSFAPDYVYERLQNYKNKGDIYFKGKIVGEILSGMPKIDLEFGCKSAQFINPSQKNSIRDLNFSGYFTNGAKRDLTTCELFIKSLSGKPEESVFNGSFHIRNFLNPYISVDFHSKIDLSTLKNFFEVNALKTLKGWLIVDMTVDELLDYNDLPTTLGKLKDGTDSRLVLKDVHFQPDSLDLPIRDLQAKLELKAGKLLLETFEGKVKDSDFSLTGSISNLASYFHNKDTTVQARLSGKANLLDLKQLAGFDEHIKNLRFDLAFETTVSYIKAPTLIPRGEFWVKNLYMDLKNYPHSIHDTHVDLLLDSTQIYIKKLETIIDKSDIHFLGKLKNYTALWEASKAGENIEADINITADELKFDELFEYGKTNFMYEDYRHEIVRNLHLDTYLRLPAGEAMKGDFLQNAHIELKRFDAQMLLHPLAFREVAGKFTTQQGNLKIQDFHAKMGKSDFNLSGQIDNVLKASEMKSKKVLDFKATVLDLDELLFLPAQNPANTPETAQNKPADHSAGYNLFALPFPEMTFNITLGQFKHQKYLLNDFAGKFRTTPNHYIYIDQMSMLTAGGKVEMDGYFNGEKKDKIYLKSNIKVANLDLDKVLYKFDNFGQDYLVSNNLHGKLSGTVKANVRMHTDLTPNLKETEAHIEGTVKEGSLVNFWAFQAMSAFFSDKDLNNVRFAEMTNVFDYKNGALTFPKMEIATTVGYIFIEGKQDVASDMAYDYDVQVPLKIIKDATWDYLFKRKRERKRNKEDRADDEVVEEIISSKEQNHKRFVTINIKGTPAEYKIKLGKSKERRRKKD